MRVFHERRRSPGPRRDRGTPGRALGTPPTPEAQLSRRHDQSFKLLFSLPLAVERMIRRFIDSDLADDLDFDRMENMATERTTPGLIRSQADLLWKIHFRGSARYLLLLIEFQSETYRYMSVRIL